MIESSPDNGTSPQPSSLSKRVTEAYNRGDESAIDALTTLLIDALRDGSCDSRCALRQFLGISTALPTQSNGVRIDRVLISRVHLFINGQNANRVQALIASYEASPPYSERRSILESILQRFVESRSELEAIKAGLADSRNFRTHISSNYAALIALQVDQPIRSQSIEVDQYTEPKGS